MDKLFSDENVKNETPVVEVDMSVSLEEVMTLSNDVDNLNNTLSVGMETLDNLVDLDMVTDSLITAGNESAEAVKLVNMQLNTLKGYINMPTSTVSVEEASSLVLSSEGVKDTIKKTWEAIKKAFKIALDSVKKFTTKMWKFITKIFNKDKDTSKKREKANINIPYKIGELLNSIEGTIDQEERRKLVLDAEDSGVMEGYKIGKFVNDNKDFNKILRKHGITDPSLTGITTGLNAAVTNYVLALTALNIGLNELLNTVEHEADIRYLELFMKMSEMMSGGIVGNNQVFELLPTTLPSLKLTYDPYLEHLEMIVDNNEFTETIKHTIAGYTYNELTKKSDFIAVIDDLKDTTTDDLTRMVSSNQATYTKILIALDKASSKYDKIAAASLGIKLSRACDYINKEILTTSRDIVVLKNGMFIVNAVY